MSKNYNNPMDSVKDFSAGMLSGSMFDASEKFSKLKSNVSFRVNSAREMVMGIRGNSAMTPMERRSEIRDRRLDLLGIKDSGSNNATTPDRSRSSSPSGRISQTNSTSTSSTTTSGTSSGSVMNNSEDSPLMSEVDKGTKARATDRGFGT